MDSSAYWKSVAQRRTAQLKNHLIPPSISAENANDVISSLECASTGTQRNVDADRKEFEAIFPILVHELIRELKTEYKIGTQAVEWITRLVNTTVPGGSKSLIFFICNPSKGKMNRGLTVLHSFELLVEHRQLSRNEIFKAQVLGWCVEWLQAFFLVADDIMDQSEQRRGIPCWYRQPHPLGDDAKLTIGNIAINDSFILESLIYRLIQKHFSGEPIYGDILDLFHDVSYRTELGQLLDLTSNLPGGKVDISRFTLDAYKKIVKYKTAYYSFYLPVALAMLLAGIRSKASFETAQDILLPMGEYFQIQDDYLDCYGDPKVIGKIGRDIEENKCTWLIVQALRKATPEQKLLLEQHYGRDNPKDVAVVKKVYEEIGIPKVFKEYEEESYNALCKQIANVRSMPRQVFTDLLAKIYKRNM